MNINLTGPVTGNATETYTVYIDGLSSGIYNATIIDRNYYSIRSWRILSV